jgi:putative tributyrin esterase
MTAREILAPLTILSLLFGCQSTPEMPSDRPQLAAGVRMQDVSFHSSSLNRQTIYRVILPKEAPIRHSLPVVYLLHGAGSDFRTWSNDSNVAEYVRMGLILVMPDGDLSYYVNAVQAKNDRYEDYITHELIPDVESRFPANRNREARAIVGVSMGGYAAIYYALKRPELFVFAGALSPAVDVPSRHFSWKHAAQWWRFRRIFGPVGSGERKALDPFQIVQTANPQVTPYIFLTAGEQEPLLEPIRRFAAQLDQRGFAHTFQTKPGGHDWSEWDKQLPACFAGLQGVVPVGAN